MNHNLWQSVRRTVISKKRNWFHLLNRNCRRCASGVENQIDFAQYLPKTKIELSLELLNFLTKKKESKESHLKIA